MEHIENQPLQHSIGRNASRLKTWTVGGKSIETPNLFASYRIRDYPRAGLRNHPWVMTNTKGLLLNAFDLLANKRTKMFTPEIRERAGKLHEYVEFPGLIVLDSGAFNFLQQSHISIKPEDVLRVGLELEADISVVLDHPFPPNSSEDDIKTRWENTKKHTQAMFNALRDYKGERPCGFQLLPVLHGHTTDDLKRSLEDIVRIYGETPQAVGIGSLAPLAKNGNKNIAVDAILAVRQMLPNAHIHCFSLGSALLMLLAFYCGADTVDSQTWIMSAAFKQVQLPGSYITRLSAQERAKNKQKYDKTRREFAEQLVSLHQEGLTVNDWETGTEWKISSEREALLYLSNLEDQDGENRVHHRACHNLASFNFEVQCVHKAILEDRLSDFIASRIEGTLYARTFEYAVKQSS